jgi:hypothetical protein
MVKFRDRVEPIAAWVKEYAKGMTAFEEWLSAQRGA